MDRAVSTSTQRRALYRRIATGLAFAGLIALGLLAFRRSLSISLDRSRLRTAVAEQGSVENTLSASGLILPEFEEIITAPVAAAVKEILVSEGAKVEAGRPLLELDRDALEQKQQRLSDELALRRNTIEKLRLELQKNLFDLEISDSIKALNISSLEADLENTRRLLRVGGATREQVDQATLELRIAKLEKKKLENNLNTKRQSMQTELRESELEARMQERSLRETEQLIEQTVVTARRPGVITWIKQSVGASIREGEQLVKIADLNSFRLEGTVADLYADRVQTGMPVLTRINDTLLTGVIANVRPTVADNVLTFDVRLDNPRHSMLRPNLRVETFIVTERHEDVVRVANGPAFDGRANLPLFIVEGDRARRRRVPIGLSNFDFVELRDQVQPGDEVIISDMSDYEHLDEIILKE